MIIYVFLLSFNFFLVLNRLIVISGPSGSGKSTLIRRLFSDHPRCFGFSVSHTTRLPRATEKDGVHYHFITSERFSQLVSEGAFIEHAVFSGNMYGTTIKAVEDVMAKGYTCIMDIDIQGAQSMKRAPMHAKYVFIAPPDLIVLEKRLRRRGTDTEESIRERLARAALELEYAKTPGSYDLVLVNDDLDETYKKLEKFCLEEIP
ncbi:guanylate kinase [Pneumocystis jirovecii RU7]|uniref:Guanylate kinase n=1 Tax=Pneumocystis jirovecii (strain RU7) TaxID=1408657 RepID=A0A0W4ZS16_PNEJ7|nr:guanylate kinase [Pneumocystis jirovecii RU7]KTW31175.1 guanylate kinase [Pneumocystis jirovecii RU7]